jgi:uncharacterized protein YyaL (SSP411 family)
LADDAMPSGNAVALEALQVLAPLAGDLRLHDAAERALQAAWPSLEQAPYAHVGLLEGLQHHVSPPEQLVIRGTPPELDRWLEAAQAYYRPGNLVLGISSGALGLPPGLSDKVALAGRTVAYRCRGSQCDPPIEDPASL